MMHLRPSFSPRSGIIPESVMRIEFDASRGIPVVNWGITSGTDIGKRVFPHRLCQPIRAKGPRRRS